MTIPVVDTEIPGRHVAIGVGNRDRADDGIGPMVVEALGRRTDHVVTLIREGDLTVLPLLWEAEDDVVIVDAVHAAGPVGKLTEVSLEEVVSSIGASTHGLNVADAVHLAQTLHCMPAHLRIIGVTAGDFAYGPMSKELRLRVDPLVDELIEVLGLPTHDAPQP